MFGLVACGFLLADLILARDADVVAEFAGCGKCGALTWFDGDEPTSCKHCGVRWA